MKQVVARFVTWHHISLTGAFQSLPEAASAHLLSVVKADVLQCIALLLPNFWQIAGTFISLMAGIPPTRIVDTA